MDKLSLYAQLEMLPAELKKQVEDFIQFLLEKEKKKQTNQSGERKLGLAKGLIEMKPGFDEPLEDFKDYME